MTSDLRLAFRSLLRNPGFSAVVVLTLALGIGANTAIFSVFDAVSIRPLPVANPGELSVLYDVGPVAPGDIGAGSGRADIYSWPLIQQFERALPAGARLAATTPLARLNAQLSSPTESIQITGQLVSGSFFSVFGVTPAAGRLLGPGDNQIVNGHPVAVLGYGFWQRQFGGDPAVVGRTLPVNGTPLTIVGVADERFRGVWAASAVDVWVPLTMQPAVAYRSNAAVLSTDGEAPWPPNPRVYWLNVVIRSAPAQRAAILAALGSLYRNNVRDLVQADAEQPQALQRQLGIESFARGFSVQRMQYSGALVVLMTLVGVLLAIACANVANLLLARWTARRREFAIRLSLGASRWALVRQLVAEAVTLSVLGGVAGLLAGEWLAMAIAGAAFERDVLPARIALDGRVLAFCVLATMVACLAFGVLPALRTTRRVPASGLRTGGAREGRATVVLRPLVVAQVSFSVVLVVIAALLGRSLLQLWRLDPGYDHEQLVQIRLDPRAGGASVTELPAIYERAVARARQLPGVVAAEVARSGLATTARSIGSVDIPGYEPAPGEEVRFVRNFVGPTYFTTVGMPMIAGRAFDPALDRRETAPVIIINETAAQRYFGGPNQAIGQRIDAGGELIPQIVGVVRNARVNALRDPPEPMMYVSLTQAPPLAQALELRISGDPLQIGETVRRIIAAEEPRLVANTPAVAVADQLERGLVRDRLMSGLAAAFGAIGLMLACVGLYGVLSYAVTLRIPEMGVRLALGATPGGLVRLIFGDGLRVTVVGVLTGLGAAALASRLLQSLLFGVSHLDPVVYLSVAAALVSIASLATYLPARRASRVNPMTALRAE